MHEELTGGGEVETAEAEGPLRWEVEGKPQVHAGALMKAQALLPLLDSILSTLRKTDPMMSGWWLFFPCHRWRGSTGLHSEWPLQQPCAVLRSRSCASKTNSASSKQIPSISYVVSLFSSVVTSSSCLSSSFLWVSSSIRSSLVSSSYLHSRVSLLQWSHLHATDLAWNKDVLLYSIQHCTVKPTNAGPCRGCHANIVRHRHEAHLVFGHVNMLHL